jgi:deoxyadenosine/deoxycytidine kinase
MAFVLPSKKLFVSMAGNIGCGKTTAAKLISQTFGFELFDEPVIDNRFLVDYYGDMKRWSFTLQLEFLLKRVQHHDIISRVPKSCVQDRTLLEDAEVFAKYLHGLGHLDNRELQLYGEYFDRLHKGLKQPDKVICLTAASVNTLLDRILTRGRPEEMNIDLKFLEGLNAYYSVLPQVCSHKYGMPVLSVDVSAIDIRSGDGREHFLDKVHSFLVA